MSAESLSLLFGAVALLAYIVAMPVALRLTSAHAPIVVQLVTVIAVHMAQISSMVAFGIVSGVELPYWNGAAVLAAGAVGYVFVFGAVYKSVSLRMLDRLIEARAADRAMSVRALTDAIVWPEVNARIALLEKAGFVARTPRGFVATEAGKRVAGHLLRYQRWFGVGSSGLY